MDWKSEIEAAEKRIRPYVRETKALPSPTPTSGNLILKLENQQHTGSFKIRGAMNKLLSLTEEDCHRGVIAASSGNHGAAVAHGASALGISASIYVPHTTDPAKVEAIRGLQGDIVFHGDDCVETERFARACAEEKGQTYISPYNDAAVIAGQGTLGVELARQIPQLEAVFISVGGGGMIGGVGAYLKAIKRDVEIVACSPLRSPTLHACLEAGRIIDIPCEDTLSDATAGGIEEDAITFELCRQVVDTSLVIEEGAIAEAMRLVYEKHEMIVEGAAGLALAGYLQVLESYKNKTVAIILCGANIGEAKRLEVFGKQPPSMES